MLNEVKHLVVFTIDSSLRERLTLRLVQNDKMRPLIVLNKLGRVVDLPLSPFL